MREDINAYKAGLFESDPFIKTALTSSDILNADGASIVFAHRILYGNKIPRVTGCDLMQELLNESPVHRRSSFLLGSTKENVELLAIQIRHKYGTNCVAGFCDGYFDSNDWPDIVNKINESGADMLFVGTPSPQKEKFIFSNIDKLNVKFAMGVGGAFDVLSGKIKRAPLWMQKTGFEWLFRLIQEPKRMWKRYLISNLKFISIMFFEKLNLLLSKEKFHDK